MGQVAITLNDRTYRLVCDDGEEDHLVDLAGIVKAKIETLRAEVGHVGDERLMLMAALLIADELVEARAAVQQPTSDVAEHAASARKGEHVAGEPEPVQRLRAVAAKLAAGGSAIGNTGVPAAAAVASKSRRRDVA